MVSSDVGILLIHLFFALMSVCLSDGYLNPISVCLYMLCAEER